MHPSFSLLFSRNRRLMRFISVFFLTVLLGGTLRAQTAYLTSGSTITLASGFNFNHPGGVAVDQYGNVFVADTGNSAVKEILAAGGYDTVVTLVASSATPSTLPKVWR